MADQIDLTATRVLSHRLFGGARYRVEIGAAIAESDGIVCMVDLIKLLGDPPGKSSVNAELKVLERANLLARASISAGERRIHLLRQDSSYWQACLELRNATASPVRIPARRSP